VLDIDLPVDEWAKEEGIADEELLSRIEQRVDEHMAAKVAQWGPDVMRYVEKTILLQTLDHLWREHLIMLDHLRQGDRLARLWPAAIRLQEYKSEAFSLFEAMVAHLREGGHRAADARRDRAAGGAAAGICRTWKRTSSIRTPARDELAFANASLVPAATANRDPQESGELGQGRPQRGLSLRLGQEVQALPRQIRVSEAALLSL